MEINKFITSVIFCITCICVIGSLQVYLLIFAFVYLLIEVIFFLFSYRKKNELFISIVRNENNNSQYYKQLITSLQQEVWYEKRKNLLDAIKSNYSSIYKNYYDTILFKNNSSLFKSLLKSFMEIGVIVVMAVLIIKTDQLSIGQLTFVISAFALFKNSSEDLFGYFLSKIEFDVYWQVYKDLTTISNVDKSKLLQFKQSIKTISFQLENEMIQLNINSFNQTKIGIMKLLKDAKNIFVNEQVQPLNTELTKQIIVIDQMTSPNKDVLLKDVEKDPTDYIQYLQYFNIDLNQKNQSYYHGLIINMLSLLHTQNQIIFIEDLL